MKNLTFIAAVAGGVYFLLRSSSARAAGAGFGFVDTAGVSHTLTQRTDGYFVDEKGRLWT